MTKMPMLCMQFDMAGMAPWNPLQSPAPEPGAYKGRIVDVDPAYNGGKSTKFTIDLLAGPSAGMSTEVYIGNEPGEKGGNKRKWLQALCGIAPDPDKFLANLKANPNLNFDPVATFKGKDVYVLVVENGGTHVNPNTGQPVKNLTDKEFLMKAQYDQVIAAGGKVAPRAGSSSHAAPNGVTAGAVPAQTAPAGAA